MTKDKALKMAIEALEESKVHLGSTKHLNDLIQACKEALELPAQEIVSKVFDIDNFHSSVLDRIKLEQPAQEPVSLGDFDNMTKAECVDYIEYLRKEIDLLRFKEWQGLSDDEREMLYDKAIEMPLANLWNDYAYLIEQALKEKNNAL